MTDDICSVCRAAARQKCGGCHLVYYCGRDHQKKDWKTHKATCKPYQICEDAVLGRHLIATRQIKQGDLILKEAPLVWGPSQVTIPVCLGCGKGLDAKNSRPCSKCGWPVCSEICQNSPSHLPECSFTVNRGDKVSISVFKQPNPSYECITVLRCLYNKQFLPDVWKRIASLQSHCEERKKTPKYENDKVTVAAFIRRFFKLEQFSEEDILKIGGIIMVNGHEVPLSDPPHVAIYETTSMFEHSCRANCSKTFTGKGEVLVTAGVPIQKGEHLSICYTDPLWGTANRRHHLYESKFFWCNCIRCSDPTEFGTNFSSIKCKNSKCKGLVYPKTFLENTREQSTQIWSCKVCNAEIGGDEVNFVLEEFGKQLQAMQKGKGAACKVFMKIAEQALSPTHYYITDVKFALAQLCGQEFHGGLPKVSDGDICLKVKMCKDVLALAAVLAPAECRIRGTLFFELHAAIAELGRRKGESGETGPDYLYESLVESRKCLVQSIEALRNESEVMPEGKMCAQARRNLKDMEALIMTVQSAVGGPV